MGFADIYGSTDMNITITNKQVRFYAQLSAVFLSLWLLGDLVSDPSTFFKRVVNHVWLHLWLVPLHFLLLEYTLSLIRLSWKRMLLVSLLLIGHLAMYSLGLYGWRLAGVNMHIYFSLTTFDTFCEGVGYMLGYAVPSVIFFGVVRHVYNYRRLKIATQQLQIEKQAAELNYLKSQTNPHFLFNTLNNIYALSRDKSDLAPESVLQLSKILRYMLYETSGRYIAIEQELKIISDYIALETLRYDESLRVNFNYDVEDMKQALPPLLLMPLVENAFKHGVSETRHQPFIDIHVSLRQRQLAMVVKNSAEGLPTDGPLKENIGLGNLRRQLELQYTDFQLTTVPGEGIFTATLQINLSSHV
jgi:two-component system, LytTR family, sensor kinase